MNGQRGDKVPRLSESFAIQNGHWFPWVPVALAIGIGTYFALKVEPSPTIWAGLTVWAAAALAIGFLHRRFRPAVWAIALVIFGVLLVGLRTHSVAAPVLGFRYYGPIEGRIVAIDKSQSNKVRLTLDRVLLHRMSAERTPDRVRVALHGQQRFITPEPGLTVILTGHLSPPGGPVEPGGFDFQRQAWFNGLGAVGYTRTPVLALEPASEGRAGLAIYRLRMAISSGIRARMPGPEGAFAAAITTGDRTAIPNADLEALRASNLAHLLAISGLHMGLLTGFVFALLRYGLALWPRAALLWPLKKIGAVGALIVGTGYLALSGGNVATERAFIMAAVVFLAVLLDRSALTLRAVAVAATIVLILRPEALVQPGFQMSFAATTALVAVFGMLRDRTSSARQARITRWAVALVISSAVAGAATAPFGAAHFNTVSHYGLLANVLSVPIMGLVIVPMAVLSAVLWPFGLSGIGLSMMKPAITWILTVAHWVAGLPGATGTVAAPPGWVLAMISLGAVFLVLWQGRLRFAGLAPVLAAFVIWVGVERPMLLVAPSGGLIGVMTDEGRALSKPRGDGFAASSWLENDGDRADQPVAATRFYVLPPGFDHVVGKGAADRVAGVCSHNQIVVTTMNVTEKTEGCVLFNPEKLRETGSLSIFMDTEDPTKLRIVSAKDLSGARPWNSN